MPKHKTAELTGDLLDAAVALADGRLVVADEPGWPTGDYKKLRAEFGGRHVVRWRSASGELGGWEPLDNQGSPSTDWSIGGPIMDREGILANPELSNDAESVVCWTAFNTLLGGVWMWGETRLIAAMRAYVASKLGTEVRLPA